MRKIKIITSNIILGRGHDFHVMLRFILFLIEISRHQIENIVNASFNLYKRQTFH